MDPGEVGPVVRALEAKGYTLDFIFNTHHHADHTGGNLGLKKKYDAKVMGLQTLLALGCVVMS